MRTLSPIVNQAFGILYAYPSGVYRIQHTESIGEHKEDGLNLF
jgi:hypothetical protein